MQNKIQKIQKIQKIKTNTNKKKAKKKLFTGVHFAFIFEHPFFIRYIIIIRRSATDQRDQSPQPLRQCAAKRTLLGIKGHRIQGSRKVKQHVRKVKARVALARC